MGLNPSQAYRLETAETAEAKYKKKEKKPAPEGWCAGAGGWVVMYAHERRERARMGREGGNGARHSSCALRLRQLAPDAASARRRLQAAGLPTGSCGPGAMQV